MDTEVECALFDSPDLLGDVIPAVGEGKAGAHAATTIPRNGIPQRGTAVWQIPSNPVGDINFSMLTNKPAGQMLSRHIAFIRRCAVTRGQKLGILLWMTGI